MVKKIFYSIALFASITFVANGQSSRSLPILEYNADVRSAGMGDAFMGEARGMFLFTNPTSFLYQDKRMYGNYSFSLFPKIGEDRQTYHAASIGYRLGRQVISVGFRWLGGLTSERIGEDLTIGKSFTSSDMVMDIGYSRSFSDRLSAYITGSFIKSDNHRTAYMGTASMGLYFKSRFALSEINCDYSLGFAASNIGGAITYKRDGFLTPASLDLGGSVTATVAENHKIGAALTTRYFILPSEASGFSVGIGAEYKTFNLFSIRAGYNLGVSNYYTAGIGVEIKNATLDLAYIGGSDSLIFKNVMRLGIGFRF